MQRTRFALALILLLASLGRSAIAQPRAVPIDTPDALTPQGVTASVVEYRGRRAVKLVETPTVETQTAAALGLAIATVKGVSLRNGTVEIDVAGSPAASAPEGSRGFIGMAFRVASGGTRHEAFYLRPTNGRADDQLRRNHSTQYISHPEFPWQRLRKENPGQYESYVDLEPGAWTRVKVVVEATTARLFVHGAEQPCLIVNDLKLGAGEGGVALWIGSGTEGYFSNLRVSPAPAGQSAPR